jgi:hypothetical protein
MKWRYSLAAPFAASVLSLGGCPEEVEVDIKPGSCPNLFNPGSQDVLTIAICGTPEHDVTLIDVDTLLLSRADGIGGSVTPLIGPPGPGIIVEDVTTPLYSQDVCDCHDLNGDGFDDLVMQFDAQELATELDLNGLPPCSVLELVVRGSTLGGDDIEGADCVAVVGGQSADCNTNGTPDECDIAWETSQDCNANGIPDECDIADGTSNDCNVNSTPDECDIADGTSDDYDLDGVPDECAPDCNTNGIPDACDLDCGAGNCVSHPLGCGSGEDCNTNHVPDECDLQHNCCELGHGPGCSDPDIEACVCAVDAYCCEVEWDTICVNEVISLGCGTCIGGASQDCNENGNPDECDIADGTSLDCDGNGILDECEEEVIPCGGLDVKPGSCPNPLNRNSRGVLPVAGIGTVDFDVTLIDVSSVLLWRADGVGDQVAPNEGPPGPHSTFEDVATPFEGEACDCHELSGDEVVDLVLKFRTDAVVEALLLDDQNHGDEIELVVTGTLIGGAEFTTAGDCILIVPQGTSNANVESNVAGLFVELSPTDLNVDDSGFANFQRIYDPGTVITLTAPPRADGLLFQAWLVDGVIQNAGETAIEITVVEDLTARALYLSATPGPTLGPRVTPASRRPTSR